MAHVRWSDSSDIYIYDCTYGGVEIHVVGKVNSKNFDKYSQLLEYMRELKACEYTVPQCAIDRITELMGTGDIVGKPMRNYMKNRS